MKKMIAAAFSLLLMAGITATAGAKELSEPQQVIQSAAGQLKILMDQDRQRLMDDPAYLYRKTEEIFLPHVDMSRVSMLVLGKEWRNASISQKQAFATEFKQLLVRTYATAMRELGEWELQFQKQRPTADKRRVLVKTQVLRDGAPPLAVDYQLHRNGDRWLAYDMKVEGISLVTNYRSSFQRLLRSKGLNGLIGELKAMNRSQVKVPGKKLASQ